MLASRRVRTPMHRTPGAGDAGSPPGGQPGRSPRKATALPRTASAAPPVRRAARTLARSPQTATTVDVMGSALSGSNRSPAKATTHPSTSVKYVSAHLIRFASVRVDLALSSDASAPALADREIAELQ